MAFPNVPRSGYSHVVPLGTPDIPAGIRTHGRALKKPWDYQVTAAVPHLDGTSIEPLIACLEVLRAQTIKPYLLVIDTGSPEHIRRELEALRAEDLEIHYINSHGYRHSSEPVMVALDLAQALCRTKLLFHTHSDCFLRRPDFVESLARVCNADTAAIGYRMSPRDWATREWEWMVGHTVLMLYMPTIHRVGATWSYQRAHYAFHYPWKNDKHGGWPDTETGFNCCLREAGIKPVFIGYDRNYERQIDDNIDHCRSFPGSKVTHSEYHENAKVWMQAAIKEAEERVNLWNQGCMTGIAPGPNSDYLPKKAPSP